MFLFDFAWSLLRGVYRKEHWYTPCARCGFSGRVHHAGWGPCWRFVPTKGRE